jgi:hypothetical protein
MVAGLATARAAYRPCHCTCRLQAFSLQVASCVALQCAPMSSAHPCPVRTHVQCATMVRYTRWHRAHQWPDRDRAGRGGLRRRRRTRCASGWPSRTTRTVRQADRVGLVKGGPMSGPVARGGHAAPCGGESREGQYVAQRACRAWPARCRLRSWRSAIRVGPSSRMLSRLLSRLPMPRPLLPAPK